MDYIKIVEIVTVYLLSTVKFLFGITGGYAAGLSVLVTMVVTTLGMMTSVVLFTYFGDWLKRRVLIKFTRKKRGKVITPRKRRIVRIWRKYGMPGVAFFTPILLMPIGGTLIAIAFGSPKKQIISYMLVSAVIWSIIQTLLLYKFADLLMPYLE